MAIKNNKLKNDPYENLSISTFSLPKPAKNAIIVTTTAPINTNGIKGKMLFLSPGNICLISGKRILSASVTGLPLAGLIKLIWNLANFHLIFSLINGPETTTSSS